MQTVTALWYADRRVIVRELARIVRSPARLTLWAVLVLGLSLNLVTRSMSMRHGGSGNAAYSGVIASFIFIGLGLSLVAVRPACFHDRAEALLLARAAGSQRIVIAYLAMRSIVLTFGRQLLIFTFMLASAFPYSSPPALLRDLLFAAASLAAIAAFALPRAVARGFGVTGYRIAGSAIVAVAIVGIIPVSDPLVRSLPFVSTLREHMPFTFPDVLAITARGDIRPVFAMIALTATAIALFIVTSGDAYPELYAASEKSATFTRRRRGETREITLMHRTTASNRRAPRGLIAIVWKGAIEAWRFPHAGWYVAGGIAAGLLAGYFGRGNASLSFTATLLIPQFVVLDGVARPADFVREFRLPLFRLSTQPLVARLAVLAFAQSMQKIVFIWCFAAGMLATGRNPVAIGFIFGAPLFLYLVSSASFALFALFPSPVDARGPLLIVRYIVILVALLPPYAAAMVAVIGFHLAVIAPIAACAVALVEAFGFIALAASQIDGRLDRLRVAG